MKDLQATLTKKQLLGLLTLAAVAVVLPLVGVKGALDHAGAMVETVRGLGWWTLPVFCLVAGLAVGCALAPSHLSSLLAGLLYGAVAGSVAALVAVVLGATLGYLGSRALAKDAARAIIDRFPWGRVLAAELLDSSTSKAVTAVTLARLPPQVPFALGNVVGASCRVPWPVFISGTLLGMAPRVILVVMVGATLSTWTPGAAIPGALWWAMGAALVGFGGLIAWSGWLLRKNYAGRAQSQKALANSANPSQAR